MNDLLSTLAGGLGGDTVNKLSDQIGAPKEKTESALGAAIPMILGALAKNSSTPDGANSLAAAVDRDHDGSVLDDVGGLLGAFGGGDAGGLASLAGGLLGGASAPTKSADGAGILKHVFGAKQPAVEQGVAKASGLDLQQAAKLLAMVAPLIMSALGKTKKATGADAGGLASMLQLAAGSVEPSQPGNEGGGLLGALLDKDDDGSVADDIAKLGAEVAGKKLLGSLFG